MTFYRWILLLLVVVPSVSNITHETSSLEDNNGLANSQLQPLLATTNQSYTYVCNPDPSIIFDATQILK
jgi:hypothetical protein